MSRYNLSDDFGLLLRAYGRVDVAPDDAHGYRVRLGGPGGPDGCGATPDAALADALRPRPALCPHCHRPLPAAPEG